MCTLFAFVKGVFFGRAAGLGLKPWSRRMNWGYSIKRECSVAAGDVRIFPLAIPPILL